MEIKMKLKVNKHVNKHVLKQTQYLRRAACRLRQDRGWTEDAHAVAVHKHSLSDAHGSRQGTEECWVMF